MTAWVGHRHRADGPGRVHQRVGDLPGRLRDRLHAGLLHAARRAGAAADRPNARGPATVRRYLRATGPARRTGAAAAARPRLMERPRHPGGGARGLRRRPSTSTRRRSVPARPRPTWSTRSATPVRTCPSCASSPSAGEQIVGHIFFSEATLESGDAVLALAPMAVLPERQRAGVGSALVREALRRAAERTIRWWSCSATPSTTRASASSPEHDHGVRSPYEVPPEAWMVHRLPAYRAEARGLVVYANAFRELD